MNTGDLVFEQLHQRLLNNPDLESITITIRRHPDGSFEGSQDMTRIDPLDMRWPQNPLLP